MSSTMNPINNNNNRTAADVAAACAGYDAELALDTNMLDPQALLAFFGAKMGTAKAKLNALVNDEDAVAKRADALNALQTLLANVGDEGMKPGNPKWDEFLSTAKAALAVVGPASEEGKQIQDLLDKAKSPQMNAGTSQDTEQEAESFRDKYAPHGEGTITKQNVNGTDFWIVKWPIYDDAGNPVCAGLSKDDAQTLSSACKGMSETLTADSQLKMVAVQQAVDDCTQVMSLATNILKKVDDMAMAPINNIRG